MNALLEGNDFILADSFVQPDVSFGDAMPSHAALGMQRYGFRIGPLGFLFPEKCTGEIVMNPEICSIPHTRKWMQGVMVLRGNLIPVFDLHDLLLDAPVELRKPMVLILDQGKQAMGLALKEPPQWLTRLIEAPAAGVALPDLIASQVSKIYRQNDTNWLAFNKTDFFTFLAENAKSC